MTLRAFSYGGGVQSTAALVLAARGEIDFPLFLFANVGDESENPATLRYVRTVARPYAERHGIELAEVQKTLRKEPETLLGRLENPQLAYLGIPLRGSDGGPIHGAKGRSCSHDFKLRPIARELKHRGATAGSPAIVGIGYSLDEWHRMRDSGDAQQVSEYPLVTLKLDRQDCENTIRAADLPVPPKSACFFCPFHTREAWRQLYRTRPDLFARAAELEQALIKKQEARGKSAVYLTRYKVPLADAIDTRQLVLEEDEEFCQATGCFT